MDLNKLAKLGAVGYKILPVCGRCKHAEFNGKDWSTCSLHQYQHQKHTLARRNLSIHFAGSCQDFATNNTENLGGFEPLRSNR